ncbi:hypothetical protein [Flavitalea sp.]|nr:hypothetical protein [Flavitalea sp.]
MTISNSSAIQLKPSETSSKDDFDFLLGSWVIYNEKLKSRLTGSNEWLEFQATGTMRKLLHGLGNIDDFIAEFNGVPFEGMSLRLFNPQTKLWNIYWSDTNSGTLEKPVSGSFKNGYGNFFARDVFGGIDILVQFKWDVTNPEKPIWSQAFSADDGKTWEWNWYMRFHKQ